MYQRSIPYVPCRLGGWVASRLVNWPGSRMSRRFTTGRFMVVIIAVGKMIVVIVVVINEIIIIARLGRWFVAGLVPTPIIVIMRFAIRLPVVVIIPSIVVVCHRRNWSERHQGNRCQ